MADTNKHIASMPPEFHHEIALKQVMVSPPSWMPPEDLPSEVYESVAAAKGVAFAYARRDGFALDIRRQDEYRVWMEYVQGGKASTKAFDHHQ